MSRSTSASGEGRHFSHEVVVRTQGAKKPMPGYARFIGRVGALAVFLGVGTAFANPGVALADTDGSNSSTGASSSNADSSAEASADTAESTSSETSATADTGSTTESTSSPTESTDDPRSGVVQASGGGNTTVKSSAGEESSETASAASDSTDDTVIPDETDEANKTVETDDETDETDETDEAEPTTDEDEPKPDDTDEVEPTTDDDEPKPDDTSVAQEDDSTTSATADDTGTRDTDVSAGTTSLTSSRTAQEDSSTAATAGAEDGETAEVTLQSALTSESAPSAEVSALAEETADLPTPAMANILTAPVTFVGGLVTTLLGMNPLVANSPVAPPESPTLWAVLAWVRRQVEYTFFNETPTANYDPTQNSQTFNGVIVGNINATDADGDKLTYTVTDGPEHGTVVVDSTGGFTYVPTAEAAATGVTDTFTITVDDRPGNPLHFHGLASLFDPNGAATAEAVVTVTVDPTSAIGTEDQIRLEQLAQQIANDPEVQAMRDTMRDHWLAVAAQKYAAIGGIDDESMSRLEEALDEFIIGAAMRVVNTDAERPEILTIALPEHDWYGISTPGGRWFYDNPDSVYRVIPVDDDSSYVITGRYVGDRPLDGNLSVYTDNSVFAPVSNLAFKDVEIAPDGTFTITIDASAANGRVNHIQLMDGANQIVVRETLGDWTENAAYLEITRVGGPDPGPAKTYDQLVDDAVALLMNDGINIYRPETDPAIFQPANVLLPPITLPGTLIGQRQSWGHFNLAANEALVVTITPGDAGYFTIPVTDIWMKTPNYWDHQSSLNSEQAIANDDGTYTIVVSKTDPGVANWVDTVGLDVGTLLVRWQSPGADPDGGDPTVSAQVVSLDQLDAVVPAETAWVTAEERQEQLDARKDAFNQRFLPYLQV